MAVEDAFAHLVIAVLILSPIVFLIEGSQIFVVGVQDVVSRHLITLDGVSLTTKLGHVVIIVVVFDLLIPYHRLKHSKLNWSSLNYQLNIMVLDDIISWVFIFLQLII